MGFHNTTPLASLLAKLSSHMQPDFLIIGAQKCGTTALYTYLAKHPQIMPAKIKEVNFFNQDACYHKGSLWYHLHFPEHNQIKQACVTFEATPYYLYYPQVAQRIYQYDPQLKLIALFRHPVERAYSAWNMHRRLFAGQVEPTLLKAIEEISQKDRHMTRHLFTQINPEIRNKMRDFFLGRRLINFDEITKQEIKQIEAGQFMPYPDYIHCGLYAQQLERYLIYFKRQQIHIVDSQQLRTNPAQVLHEITQFLDLPEHNWEQENLAEARDAYQYPLDEKTRRRLHAFYQSYNEQLYDLIGHDFNWH